VGGKPKAEGRSRKNMADGKGQIANKKPAKRAAKVEKSKLIVPNRGGEKSEGRNLKAESPKAAGNEQPRPNVGLAKETKGNGKTKSRIQGMETDETGSTDGTEVEMGSVAEAEATTGTTETPVVTAPALTAKQKAYNAWFQMLHYAIPFDETELERLNAEAEKEEGVEMKNEE